jgi:D-glycero-D-manno-heptose 1,7-bisphosphate phosphatase
MRSAVFLDRDDTLIANAALARVLREPGYLYDPELVELLPGAAWACARLKAAGHALVVVTNQSAVARGYCDIAQVDATNARVRELLRTHAGVDLDGCYVCPYSPDGRVVPYNTDHPWRKPNPGMLLWAADDLRLDLSRSWMIGDARRDIAAAVRAGIAPARTILIGDHDGPGEAGALAPDLARAADLVLTGEGGSAARR